jgi:hypothetical protein
MRESLLGDFMTIWKKFNLRYMKMTLIYKQNGLLRAQTMGEVGDTNKSVLDCIRKADDWCNRHGVEKLALLTPHELKSFLNEINETCL